MSAAAIEARLRQALAPSAIEVVDDGHLHVGHAGAREGGHYTVKLRSERFRGLSRLQRHRLVYDSLGPLAALGVHALAVRAYAADEDS
ncbi:MAG: BolA family transcriptional regulator [Burkholderiales bacterium]|nr:BolA family transcriptional regulator [Burkholderiales bacterium]MDE1927733.1 BolA family transcriptional regulator [Burkholderiales bacterium]MDE2158186.1 BolA family transcriptional regulator [Burkholderiales bacterium]MDE2504570.1 BolA family transcriptional regulator [Burkholderiales bacterium]